MHKALERRSSTQWIKVEVIDLLCPECEEWFSPKAQPPREPIFTCAKQRCRLASWRRRKKAAAAGADVPVGEREVSA